MSSPPSPHDIKNGVKYQVFLLASVSSLKFLDGGHTNMLHELLCSLFSCTPASFSLTWIYVAATGVTVVLTAFQKLFKPHSPLVGKSQPAELSLRCVHVGNDKVKV